MVRLIRSRLSYKVAVGASALTLFVVLVTGAAAYLVMSGLIRAQTDELLRTEASQRAEKVGEIISSIITQYHRFAANAVVGNALVDSLGREAYLAPLLAELSEVNGVPVSIAVTDHLGRVLVTAGRDAQEQPPEHWVADLVERNSVGARIGADETGPVITIAEPVIFINTGTPEGALVYRIRSVDLVRRLGAVQSGRGVDMMLTEGGRAHVVAGQRGLSDLVDPQSVVAPVPLPALLHGLGMAVRVGVERAVIDAPVSRLSWSFAVIGMGTVFAVVVVSVLMGRRLTMTLTRLSDAATGFAFGRRTPDQFLIGGEDEIARLGRAFAGMVDRLDRAYQDLERRSQTLLSNAERVAQVGSGVWDLGTGRQVWSDQFHAILGLEPETAQAGEGAFFDRVHPDDRPQLAGALKEALMVPEGRVMQDFRILRPDGTERVAQLRGQVLWEDFRPLRLDLTLQDITERHRLEHKLDALVTELRRSNEELEQFAYVASHDLRQPLRVVGSYVTLIEESIEDKLDGETHEFMDFIRDGVRRMDLLITDLLAYSRVGRTSRDGPVDTGRALDLALMDLQVEIDEARAQVKYPPSMPVVTGDVGEMTRLFLNLVGNAVKYRSASRRPVVEVGCVDRGMEWEFSVADNGIGIDAEHQGRVFGIFQRLHARDEYDGTGIGLAICKKVVERQGGRIWIDECAAEGTTFRFSWPKLRRTADVVVAQ